jgi:hypothetical protein
MAKEVAVGAEAAEALGQGVVEIIEGAGRRVTQVRFEFGKGLFDRVEIRAISGQVAHAGSARVDEFGHGGDLVSGEDDNVACLELGTEHVLEVGREDGGRADLVMA